MTEHMMENTVERAPPLPPAGCIFDAHNTNSVRMWSLNIYNRQANKDNRYKRRENVCYLSDISPPLFDLQPQWFCVQCMCAVRALTLFTTWDLGSEPKTFFKHGNSVVLL